MDLERLDLSEIGDRDLLGRRDYIAGHLDPENDLHSQERALRWLSW